MGVEAHKKRATRVRIVPHLYSLTSRIPRTPRFIQIGLKQVMLVTAFCQSVVIAKLADVVS